MKVIRLTDERYNTLLPNHIKDSDVISLEAKKILASLLNYYIILDIVKNTGFLIIPNGVLRESAGIGNDNFLTSIQELIECDLIKRECGRRRRKGEKSTASSYTVLFENLKKPLHKKQSFEELFADFFKDPKSSETPISIIDTDDVDESVNVSVYESVYDNVSVCDYVDVNENVNAIGNSCNSNQMLIDFVNKQLEGKMTYDEVKKQITPIQDFIKSNWSKDNVERMTEISNKLINEKFKEIETVKTDTVHVN